MKLLVKFFLVQTILMFVVAELSFSAQCGSLFSSSFQPRFNTPAEYILFAGKINTENESGKTSYIEISEVLENGYRIKLELNIETENAFSEPSMFYFERLVENKVDNTLEILYSSGRANQYTLKVVENLQTKNREFILNELAVRDRLELNKAPALRFTDASNVASKFATEKVPPFRGTAYRELSKEQQSSPLSVEQTGLTDHFVTMEFKGETHTMIKIFEDYSVTDTLRRYESADKSLYLSVKTSEETGKTTYTVNTSPYRDATNQQFKASN